MLSLEQINVYLTGTRKYTWRRLSAQNGLLALVMGTLGIGLVLSAPALLPGFYAGTSFELFVLAGCAIPFILHINSCGGLLTLQGRVAWPFLSRFVAATVQAVLVVALYVFHRLTPSSVLASFLAAAIVNWIMVAGGLEGRWLLRIGWDGELLRDTLRQTLLIHCGMVLWFLHLRADLFMTKGRLGLAALGQYSLAVTLAETTLLLTDSLSRAILPRQVAGETAAAAALSLRASRTNLMVGAIAALGWLISGPWLIPFCFGAAFRPTYLPLIALMPGVAFVGMQQVCGGAVLRDGKPWKFPAIYSVSLTFNIILNLILIPAVGIAGASIASSISYGIGLIMFVRWTARLANKSMWEGLIPRKADVAHLYQTVAHDLAILDRKLLTEAF